MFDIISALMSAGQYMGEVANDWGRWAVDNQIADLRTMAERTNFENDRAHSESRQDRDNRLMREREDNAVQRQANDMRLAGINPLMAGLSGQGGAHASQGQIISSIQSPNTPNTSRSPSGSNINLGDLVSIASLRESQRKKTEKETLKVEPEIDNIIANTERTIEDKKKLIKAKNKLHEEIKTVQILNKKNNYKWTEFLETNLKSIKNSNKLQFMSYTVSDTLDKLYREQKKLTGKKADRIKHEIINMYIKSFTEIGNSISRFLPNK